jgi:hypothetical protein
MGIEFKIESYRIKDRISINAAAKDQGTGERPNLLDAG